MRPGTNGDGGRITASGQRITINGFVDADGRGAGAGGFLDLQANDSLTVNGTLTANGGNNGGDAGVINIHDTGSITLEIPTIIRANAENGGRAGSITLSQTGSGPMILEEATISASGGCDGDTCGVINITTVGEMSMVGTKVFANGTLGANGGQVNVVSSSETATVKLDDAQINVSGHQSGGNGGFINVDGATVTVETPGPPGEPGSGGVVLTANGFVGGHGGQVRITTTPAHPLSVTAADVRIFAKGGESGDGGIVVVPYLAKLGQSQTNYFYVNTFINASAGTNVIGTSHFGGSISINGRTCRKIFTGYTWPTAYWNCANPASPTATDGLPANQLQTLIPGSIRPQLTTNSAVLYVFQDNANLKAFFNSDTFDPVAGLTVTESPVLPRIAINVAVLEKTTFPGIGFASLSDEQLIEATSHEFGHAIDFSGGIAGTTSDSPAYLTRITNDRAFLDNAGLPCQLGSAGPFNGLVDPQTNQQFCSNAGTGDVLNDPNGVYTGKTNSEIAAISQPGVFGKNSEIFAQAFAYQDYVKNLANQTGFFLTQVANGLFQKGYFGCAQEIGAQGAGTSHVSPYSCN